jgi:hypothetical protein
MRFWKDVEWGEEDSNNEQEASSAGPRKPSVKKIRQTKSTTVASSANQMLLQKRTNKTEW